MKKDEKLSEKKIQEEGKKSISRLIEKPKETIFSPIPSKKTILETLEYSIKPEETSTLSCDSLKTPKNLDKTPKGYDEKFLSRSPLQFPEERLAEAQIIEDSNQKQYEFVCTNYRPLATPAPEET